MTGRYPRIEPYAHGMLDVGDGQSMAYARIVTHYFHHHAWIEDNGLLRHVDRLSGIPGVLAHGRLDLGGPPDTAWKLSKAWPDAELCLVASGHTGGPDMDEILIAATDRFASG